jgi:hypothetical protein
MTACSIDLITNTEVSGTTSTLVGSARILSGSNINFSFRAMMGPASPALVTSSLEIKRFTGGASVFELTASGIGLQDISGSAIAIPADDWYEFYLSGSSITTVSLVKGIRVVLS